MSQQGIQDKLKTLPAKPGVYLFLDAAKTVLYVGKASNLQNRVRSHFSPYGQTPKLQTLVSKTADIDFIITSSEQESFILENNLIKKYQPRYNVRLKDDKTYPYLKIALSDDWPNIQVTRRLIDDGSRYFGPFASASSLRRTMNLLNKLFPYRTCKGPITGTSTRPCLEYHLNRCAGPCIGAVSKEEYRGIIDQVILFLEGKHERIIRQLKSKMAKASANLEFEKAASIRDQIQSIESIMEQQKVVSNRKVNEDVIAIARDSNVACAQVFSIRGGKLLGKEHFIMEGIQDESPAEIIASFVEQFYGSGANIPPQILLQVEADNPQLVESGLVSKSGHRVRLIVPRRGEKKKLVDMVAENASDLLEQFRIKWLADSGKIRLWRTALEELKEALSLPRLPNRIECYDISNIRGTSAVGSMVVFENGQPKRSHYRRFKIKSVSGIDDYAMMQEVIRRRLARASTGEGQSWGIVPDLVLIDGGRGHLNAVLEILRRDGAEAVPVASIAKEYEELFVPEVDEPIRLPNNSQALYLVQRIRDEAHRFAITYHQNMRGKSALTSGLDEVPGIGPKRKKALLRKFGSVKRIREASANEIASVQGMSKGAAEKVKEYL
ncbi:MAG: excinuclease ABC subunit UvrC [Dehalococcoidia bacterium]